MIKAKNNKMARGGHAIGTTPPFYIGFSIVVAFSH
jgi:hypothetical protein